MYTDFRFYSSNTDEYTNIWIALFSADLSKYLGEIRVTPESFDIRQAFQSSHMLQLHH